jgi:hypothetical protein
VYRREPTSTIGFVVPFNKEHVETTRSAYNDTPCIQCGAPHIRWCVDRTLARRDGCGGLPIRRRDEIVGNGLLCDQTISSGPFISGNYTSEIERALSPTFGNRRNSLAYSSGRGGHRSPPRVETFRAVGTPAIRLRVKAQKLKNRSAHCGSPAFRSRKSHRRLCCGFFRLTQLEEVSCSNEARQ